MVFGPVPPVPVAALRDQYFFESQLALNPRSPRRILCVEVSRLVQVVPSTIVFGRADPDVEIGVDPGAGCERRYRTRSCLWRAIASDIVTASMPGLCEARHRSGEEIHDPDCG